MTAQHDGIHLADGFHFTDHLASPYQLVYGHKPSVHRAVYISNIDGSERRILLEAGETRAHAPLCFSPDGSTLYAKYEHIQVTDIPTGQVQILPDVPIEPPYEHTYLLECSPDNSTLLLWQQPRLPATFSHPLTLPLRFCRVSTNGTDFRVLAEDSPDISMKYADCHWEENAAIVYRCNSEPGSKKFEFCRMDLNTGALTYLCPATEWCQYGDFRANSNESIWSTPAQEIYACLLTDCVTRKLPVTGNYPIWSPNGKQIAFVQDRRKVCLWDMESQCEQYIIGFMLPNRPPKEEPIFWMTPPVWSPEAQMFWFEITKMRSFRNDPSACTAISEYAEYLEPLPLPLERKWTDFLSHGRHLEPTSLMGIVDLSTQQVMLYNGYLRGVTWLPRPENGTKA